jgi:hypothetical protein
MKKASGMSNIDIVKSYVRGDRPFSQVGYNENTTKRKEGEVWKSKGQTWTIKNGVKIAINSIGKNIDLVREECKGCHKNIKLFGDRLDVKMYKKTGNCFDCQIKFESELKRKGKYEKYEKLKIFHNQKSFCLDLKQKLEESIQYLETSGDKIPYMLEDGRTMYWDDTMREKVLNDAKNDYKECLESLERIEGQLKSLNERPSNN